MFVVAMYALLIVGALWLAITTVAGLRLHAAWSRRESGLATRVLYAFFLGLLCAPPACYVLGNGEDVPEAILPTPLLAFGVPFAAVFVFGLLVFPQRAFRGPARAPEAGSDDGDA